MNFTNSPYEKMMKEIPRPGRGGADRCAGCRPAQGGERGGGISGKADGGVIPYNREAAAQSDVWRLF